VNEINDNKATNSKEFNGYSLELLNVFNNEQQIQIMERQLIKIEQEMARSQSILRNEEFLAKASAEKIESEKKKYEEYLRQFDELRKILG
jgi:valyl-tRNA synthetase